MIRKFALFTLLALGGCTTTYGITCPELKNYSKTFQTATAKELPKAGPHVQTMVNDYGALRNAIRICQKRQKKS